MAIYAYVTATGVLVSWIPDNLTIAQAQAQGLLANPLPSGISAVDSLPPLDASHVWDPTTKTVDTITPPTPPNVIATYDYIMAFTPAELAAIRASSNNAVQQQLFAMQTTQGVNLNSTTINTQLSGLVTLGLLTQARANAILATVSSKSASPNGS